MNCLCPKCGRDFPGSMRGRGCPDCGEEIVPDDGSRWFRIAERGE